jgi:Domain of unknown function (DUF4394)
MNTRTLLPLAVAAVLGACATPEPLGPLAKEEIVAVTVSNQLLRFNAGQPQAVRDKKPLTGLRAGERLLGIDFRVARGELFALGGSGQLYKIDVGSAVATPVGTGVALPAGGADWGVDFNPTVDRIRVVSDNGVNLRLHPDTGALVATDGQLAYADGKAAAIVAAGYTYNKSNDKITTNYALDGAAGTLVHQGTKEGVTPAVSPNTGQIFSVGSLGAGPFAHATFDISDVSNAAYAGLRTAGATATRWHHVDLASGKARFIGTVGGGEALVGAAIEP